MSIHRLDEVVLQRILHFSDEAGVCALSTAGRSFQSLAADGSLWKALALLRDPRLAYETFSWLGERSKTSVWRGACHRLNSKLAPPAWPKTTETEAQGSASPQTRARLDDVFNADGLGPNLELPEHIRAASDVGVNGLWAGQSPHLFRISEGRLLSVGGGFYADGVGGAEVHPLHDVALLDLSNGPNTPRFDTLIQGVRPEGQAENCHPLLHGSASDWDAKGSRALFFAGGAPHTHLTDETSALQLTPTDQAPFYEATWHRLAVPGERPSPRQGCRGLLFENSFYIFGGRERGGDCLNDVWSLELEREGGILNKARSYGWKHLYCEGQAPSPRVWPSCCHANYGKWFVLGGSEWQFEVNEEVETDFQTLYILDIRERSWSSLAPSAPPTQPSWLVSSCLVPIGHREVLYLGGTMPHLIGAAGLDMRALHRWREFYARLDRPWLLDLKTSSWRQEEVLLGDVGKSDIAVERSNVDDRASEVLYRSHAAAVYMPERGSVFIFGGSRYFTGEYFHDLIELKLPVSSSVNAEEGPASSPASPSRHPGANNVQGQSGVPSANANANPSRRGEEAAVPVASSVAAPQRERRARDDGEEDNDVLDDADDNNNNNNDPMEVDEEDANSFKSAESSDNSSIGSSDEDEGNLPELAGSLLENEAPPFMATRNSRFRAGNQSLLTRGFRGRVRAMARSGLLPMADYRHVLTL